MKARYDSIAGKKLIRVKLQWGTPTPEWARPSEYDIDWHNLHAHFEPVDFHKIYPERDDAPEWQKRMIRAIDAQLVW